MDTESVVLLGKGGKLERKWTWGRIEKAWRGDQTTNPSTSWSHYIWLGVQARGCFPVASLCFPLGVQKRWAWLKSVAGGKMCPKCCLLLTLAACACVHTVKCNCVKISQATKHTHTHTPTHWHTVHTAGLCRLWQRTEHGKCEQYKSRQNDMCLPKELAL